MKLVTSAQMRALEQAAVDAGATWSSLMEQAGWGVAQEALRILGEPRDAEVLVLVGPGNNGGDALVVARHLHDAGARVVLYIWHRNRADDPNRQRCRERDIAEIEANNDANRAELRHELARAQLVIDGLLGIGVNRPLAGDLTTIIEAVNTSGQWTLDDRRGNSVRRPPLTVLAIDLPTGVDADTGAIHGAAIEADLTVATGLIKRGSVLYPGRDAVGEIRVADIGLGQLELEGMMSDTITSDRVRALLPRRPNTAHKGSFGKAMVVAGSLHYPGAATLATAGALRVGAGLVTLATGRGAIGAPGRLPEVTLRPLPDEGMGVLGAAAADELFKHLEGYTVLLIGPGLGQEEPTEAFLAQLLGLNTPKQRGHIGFRVGATAAAESKERPELPPLVIDADGLNLLAKSEQWWEHLPANRAVLTPHPGEMKRLLAVDELPGDPVDAAEQAAARWKQVVVLKGATTAIAEPGGRSAVLDGGNAALATAGTGDVLAGAITGLIAQGLNPFDAAVAGVYLHSTAGRILRDDLGDAGTIASDLLARLPLAIKSLK